MMIQKIKQIAIVIAVGLLVCLSYFFYSYWQLTQKVKALSNTMTLVLPVVNFDHTVVSTIIATTTDQNGLTPFQEAVYQTDIELQTKLKKN